jgi:hypothetical protein
VALLLEVQELEVVDFLGFFHQHLGQIRSLLSQEAAAGRDLTEAALVVAVGFPQEHQQQEQVLEEVAHNRQEELGVILALSFWEVSQGLVVIVVVVGVVVVGMVEEEEIAQAVVVVVLPHLHRLL